MSLSDKLGNLNFDRFLNWHRPFDATNAKQAVLAFEGDVYTGLDAESFNSKDFKFAQKHLRILSDFMVCFVRWIIFNISVGNGY